MNAGSLLLFWLVIKPLSLLPYRLLYVVSDVLFFFLYHITPYRKKVALDNLRQCFPEKNEKWVQATCKKFYRHFCDLVVESLKNFSISSKDAQAHLVSVNSEIINAYFEKGQSVILCGGHMSNWELWAIVAPSQLKHRLIGIYKELSNPFFDEKMRESRGKYGLIMIPTYATRDYMKKNNHEINAPVLAIDQSPGNSGKGVWITFMGRETAAFLGAEKYAKDFRRPIIYGHLEKVKRGYYRVWYEVVTEHPEEYAFGGLTQKLHDMLEADIRTTPEFWLWTHKRWKHKRPAHIKMIDRRLAEPSSAL